MHYLRAIMISVITYILTLLVGLGAIMLTGKSIGPDFIPSRDEIIASMVLAAIFTTAAAVAYFRPAKVRASARLGFGFGVVATLVAFVLDGGLALVAVQSGQDPSQLFTIAYSPWLLVSLLGAGLLGTTLVGWRMGKMQISID